MARLTNKQRAENAIKWIDTLGRTRMKQGCGMLGESGYGYCCLGVACKALGVAYDPADGSLSSEQRDLIGLGEHDGAPIMPTSTLVGLTTYNDWRRFSFRDISAHLKEHTDAYFVPGVAKLIKKHYRAQQ